MSPAQHTIETIDHVTIAATNLATLEENFARVGLRTEYGGPHSNGATHMALLGFDDGSYIELIALLAADRASPLWQDAITGDAGPCAWAVDPGVVADEAARVAALGVPVRGPQSLNRLRPDGRLVEWDLAFPGDGQPGNLLPFIIHDRTPRDWRVQPSPAVHGSELTGIAMVVLGVADSQSASNLFQTVYSWTETATQDDPLFGATLTHFPGTPVTLATPLSGGDWLAERLRRFGPLPCAFLIGTKDMATSVRRFSLGEPHEWFGHELRWFDPTQIGGLWLGMIEHS
jgi:hypothetical protein